jgi:hypothetical protein
MPIMCATGDSHLATTVPGVNYTSATSPFSVVCWINGNWASTTTISFVGIYGPTITAPTTAIQIGTRGAGLVSCWTWGGAIMVQSPATVISNVWHHIGYTFDGGSHRLYVDGVLVATSTTAQIAGTLSSVFINGYPTGIAQESSTHQVANYSYFNRQLSNDEILTIYYAKGSRHGIVYGVLAEYQFDEGVEGGTSSQVNDLSGNGNNLISSGSGLTPITYTYSGAVPSSNTRRVH